MILHVFCVPVQVNALVITDRLCAQRVKIRAYLGSAQVSATTCPQAATTFSRNAANECYRPAALVPLGAVTRLYRDDHEVLYTFQTWHTHISALHAVTRTVRKGPLQVFISFPAKLFWLLLRYKHQHMSIKTHTWTYIWRKRH